MTRAKIILYIWLHGAGGDEDAWTTLGRAQHILDNLIATGKAKPMVVVMTNGNPNCQAAPGEWSAGMYVPSFNGYQGAKAVATMDERASPDVMNYVESHYKVGKDKAHRAICGLSMGGGHFDISRRFLISLITLVSSPLVCMWERLAIFAPISIRCCKRTREAKQQLATLFKNKPKLYWIGMGKTDFCIRVQPACVAISMRRGINIPIWRRRAATSGATGVCILQSSHRRFSNDKISFSSNSLIKYFFKTKV